ncbi:hypothetical protein Sjap_013208 [Stephania japonica]|uniref:Uncharacterized protein n=1 Tax=Stephania japonica TaxID=461633 RepID=A0AAP0IXH9_9MAGN
MEEFLANMLEIRVIGREWRRDVLRGVEHDTWRDLIRWSWKSRLAGPVAERHVACRVAGKFTRVSPKFWETVWMRISRKIDELERGDCCFVHVAVVDWWKRC